MTSRASHLAAAVIGLAAILAGCAPTATAPQPTPTFSSDAEAFAAAEATYREYVKALNAVDLSDPETFEGVYALTTGEANNEARRRFSRMHAEGWLVGGKSVPVLIDLASATDTGVHLAVCVDVSKVTLVDAEGISQVGTDRPDVQRMLVTVVPTTLGSAQLAISDVSGRSDGPECD